MTQTVRMTFASLNEVVSQIKTLEHRKKELTAQLVAVIPGNSVVDGVRHVAIESTTISYAEAVKASLKALTPKGRVILQAAVESCTKKSVTHRIQADKDAL